MFKNNKLFYLGQDVYHVIFKIFFVKIAIRKNILDYFTNNIKAIRSSGVELTFILSFVDELKHFDLKEKYSALIGRVIPDWYRKMNKIISFCFKFYNSDKTKYEQIYEKTGLKKIKQECAEFHSRVFKINNECYVYNKYFLPKKHFEACVFKEKYGLEELKNKEYFKNKDIIDAGAFIGDSAIVLSDYTNKKVYSFEPTSLNYQYMLKTIELNKKENIIPVNLGLGDKEEEIEMGVCGSGSGILTVIKAENTEKCKVTTLDKYVQENNLEVGLIKTDLEGFEQNFIKGAINTIKKFSPTLLISIYHTPSDFFDIKPMIESLSLDYNYRIVKPKDGLLIVETMLVCEPKENI